MPEEVELAHHECLKSRLEQLISAMTSLTKRLTGEGTGQAMEYEEELVHNVLMAAQNAIVSIAREVKGNILYMMTALVIAPQPTVLQTPAATPLHTLLRVPNALVIK